MRLATAYTNAAMVPPRCAPPACAAPVAAKDIAATPARPWSRCSALRADPGVRPPRAQNITLPAHVTWNDVSVLAVWCEQVRAALPYPIPQLARAQGTRTGLATDARLCLRSSWRTSATSSWPEVRATPGTAPAHMAARARTRLPQCETPLHYPA